MNHYNSWGHIPFIPFLCRDQAKPDPIAVPIPLRHCLLDKTRLTQWAITTPPTTPTMTPTSEYNPGRSSLPSPGAHSAAHSELTPEQLDEYEDVSSYSRSTAHH